MRCQSTCHYLIGEEDTSGRYLGLEAEITFYSCGIIWPRIQFICSRGLGEAPTKECIQKFERIPEGSKRVTFSRLESQKEDKEFRARDEADELRIRDLIAEMSTDL